MPSITNTSYPADFKSIPKCPPELHPPTVPVRGDLATIAKRLVVGALIPVSGPVANINLFLIPKASVLAGTSSKRIFEPNPLPPIKFNNSFSGIFSVRTL